jgi:hypothetical protein
MNSIEHAPNIQLFETLVSNHTLILDFLLVYGFSQSPKRHSLRLIQKYLR